MKFPVFSICPIKVERPCPTPACRLPAGKAGTDSAGGRGSLRRRVDTSNGTFYALTDTKRKENFLFTMYENVH